MPQGEENPGTAAHVAGHRLAAATGVAEVLNEDDKPASETSCDRYDGDSQHGENERVGEDRARNGDDLADLCLHALHGAMSWPVCLLGMTLTRP